MLIDGPITTQTIDSSGEILDLKGLDISDFLEGKATANFEHNNDNPGDVLGWFTYAKKIFKEADCENERQKMFWEKVKTPFLYGVLELLDDENHPGAVAVAAMLRHFKKKNEPVKIGMSIEGSTLERDGHILKRTVGRKVAITLRPCNKQCMLDVMPQEQTDSFLNKMESSKIQSFEIDSPILEEPLYNLVHDIKKDLENLKKTLTAGMGNAAPSNLTGGSALSVEGLDRTTRNTLKSVLRDWDRKTPLRKVVKAALPNLSDKYVDHFVDLAEELSLKKSEKTHFYVGNCLDFDNSDTQLGKIGNASDWEKLTIEESYKIPKKKFEEATGEKIKAINYGAHPKHGFVWAEIPNKDKKGTIHLYYFPKNIFGTNKFIKSESLHKGAKGDWQKEGYKINHQVLPDGLYIQAFSPEGKHAGSARLSLKENKLHPDYTEVLPEHQRKGLASSMYNYAKNVMEKKTNKLHEVIRGETQSEQAKKMWEKK